jgi:hypothetical protein
VKTVLSEVGIDLSEGFTRPLTREVLAGADVDIERRIGALADELTAASPS